MRITPRILLGSTFLAGICVGISSTAIGASLAGSSIFADVQPGSYYDSAIGEMYQDGVIKGKDANHFAPNDYITRGDVALLLQRFKNGGDYVVSSSSSSRSSANSSSSSSVSSNSPRTPQGALRFTAPAYTVSETAKTLTVGIMRVGGSDGQITVDYSMTPGTASVDTDYTPISGTLVFAEGATSKTLTINILDDSSSEGSETATIRLTNVTNGGTIESPSSAVITITDNETSSSSAATGSSSSNAAGIFDFSAAGYAVNENSSTATITVARQGSAGSVSVNYATGNGTAVSGTDYTPVSGTLNFAAGETTKTFSVPILDDQSSDGRKTVTLLLSTPTGGSAIGTASISLAMMDNETEEFGSGSLKFSKSSLNIEEGNPAVITIQRVGGAQGTITVAYSTTSGSASTNDYNTTSGTLTFLPGESSKVIKVPTIHDNVSDPGETFSFYLSNPSTGVTLLDPYNMTVTIDE